MNEKTQPPAPTLRDWLEGLRDKFSDAIPKNTVDITRFISAASMEILGNPKLQSCTKASLTQALIQSARYGLEVGALLGQAWIIPYNESKRMEDGSWNKVMTARFQLGYKGLIVLARRSKTIKTISAKVVHENDIFEVDLGLHPNIVHKLNILQPRGEPLAYYCAVELENGGTQFEVLTMSDVVAHRDQYSKGFVQSPKDNPWTTNPDAMALKTVVIKTLKFCPMSVEALEAVGREEREMMPVRNVTLTQQYESLPEPSAEGRMDEESAPTVEDTREPVKAKTATQAKAEAIFHKPIQSAAPEQVPEKAVEGQESPEFDEVPWRDQPIGTSSVQIGAKPAPWSVTKQNGMADIAASLGRAQAAESAKESATQKDDAPSDLF